MVIGKSYLTGSMTINNKGIIINAKNKQNIAINNIVF